MIDEVILGKPPATRSLSPVIDAARTRRRRSRPASSPFSNATGDIRAVA